MSIQFLFRKEKIYELPQVGVPLRQVLWFQTSLQSIFTSGKISGEPIDGAGAGGEILHRSCWLTQFSAKLILKALVFFLTDVKLQGSQRSKDILHTYTHQL